MNSWHLSITSMIVVLGLFLNPARCKGQTQSNKNLSEKIRNVVNPQIAAGRLPGCVVAIGNSNGIDYLESFGNKRLKPTIEQMATDTVFDLASLTKPIATATATMCLIEDGLIRLNDRVSEHLPEFRGHQKENIRIKDLLVHTSGLIPDNALSDYDGTPTDAWQNICKLDLVYNTGADFSYSDVGFLVLARLIEKTTGKNLEEFAQQRIFRPLSMHETCFCPPEPLRHRAAPTEERNGHWIQGKVHDPRAFRLGGIAGHAGLFSTASDLSRYARMMLKQGTLDGHRVLHPMSIRLMTKRNDVPKGTRGLGWDIQSPYSSNRSDLYSASAYGHGGFTGTALWIDPDLDLFVIFLSNRVHPNGNGSVNKLAARVGSIAVANLSNRKTSGNRVSNVKLGIDILRQSNFEQLAGKRIGLITNHTGIDSNGESSVQLLHDAPHVRLVKLFSPEHGFEGQLDQSIIADSVDSSSGLKVVSLYGEKRQPNPDDLSDIDTLVFDVQDIGTRFYTYISTMGLAMQSAAAANIEFMVLDRPNPIGGEKFDGPISDSSTFTAFHPLPVRHGMTIGELAQLFNQELNLNLKLSVLAMTNWKRNHHWDQTGLLWVNPSPNMRSPAEALLYPGIGLLETTNLSVGRGTDTPFEVLGAPWIHARTFSKALNDPKNSRLDLCYTNK